ncbi:MAG: winged helix-turn-helix transcriptional regulator [Rikenellaceae bacterium]|nr:winged helix-turn-helix transcriptional regulator [Rikenellaceae bacterium]
MNERKILENISADQYITSDKLSKIVGITAGNIMVNLSKLKSKGLLERVGGDRGGYWKIKR